jgi:hypothetical protein
MSMYTEGAEGADLQVTVLQGERGMIRQLDIATSSGTNSLEAAKCVAGTNVADSWTYSGAGEDLQLVSGWKRVKNPAGIDTFWYVNVPESGLYMTVVCTGTKKRGRYGNFRLNVQELIAPNATASGVGGFCATSSFSNANSSPVSTRRSRLARRFSRPARSRPWHAGGTCRHRARLLPRGHAQPFQPQRTRRKTISEL